MTKLNVILFHVLIASTFFSHAQTKPKVKQNEPFIGLEISRPPEALDLRGLPFIELFNEINLESLFLCFEAENGFLRPVLLLKSKEQWSAEKTKVLMTFMGRDFTSQLIFSKFKTGQLTSTFDGQYFLMSSGKTTLTIKSLLKCRLKKRIADGRQINQLAALSCILPKEINLLKYVGNTPQDIFYFSDYLIPLIMAYKSSLESIEYFTLSLFITNDLKTVSIRQLQKFRKKDSGKKALEILEGKKAPYNFDFANEIYKLLNHDFIKKQHSYKDSVLESNIKISQPKSSEILDKQIELFLNRFKKKDQNYPMPSQNKVLSFYSREPLYTAEDINTFKRKFTALIPEYTFPRDTYPKSNVLRIDFDKPSHSLLKGNLYYKVHKCTDSNGVPLALKEDKKLRELNKTISIHFEKTFDQFALGKLILNFVGKAPIVKDIIEFHKGDEAGKVIRKGKDEIKLLYIQNNAVKVQSYNPKTKLYIIAYDESGKVLLKRDDSYGSYGRFAGEVSKIKVLIYEEKDFNLVTEVDTKKKLLSKGPLTFKFSRIGPEPKINETITTEELKKTKITYGSKNHHRHVKLSLPGSLSPTINWTALGLTSPTFVTFTGVKKSMEIELEGLHASTDYIGYLYFTVQNLEKIQVKKPDHDGFIKLHTSERSPIDVRIDKNKLSIKSAKFPILSVTAYDKSGIIIKEGLSLSQDRTGELEKYFWGNIETVKIYLNKGEQAFYFDIGLTGKTDPGFLKKVKSKLAKHREIMSLLRQAAAARKKLNINFTQNFSYLYHAGKLIPKDMAHSDPLGEHYFEYKAKPFKGYTFTLAKGYTYTNGRKRNFDQLGIKDQKLVLDGKEIDVRVSNNRPAFIIAVPTDLKNPTYYITDKKIFWKTVNQQMQYFPSSNLTWNYESLK